MRTIKLFDGQPTCCKCASLTYHSRSGGWSDFPQLLHLHLILMHLTSHPPISTQKGLLQLVRPRFHFKTRLIWCSCFNHIRTPTYWLKSCVKEIWFTYLRCKSPTTQHNWMHAKHFIVPLSVLLIEEAETRLTDGSDTTTTCTFSLSSPLSLGLFTLEVEEKLMAWYWIVWQGNAVQTK